MSDVAVGIAVVGAGPAGLAAAIAAAGRGCPVALYDENPAPGGQLLYRRPDRLAAIADWPIANPPSATAIAALAPQLAERATAAGVELFANATVWAIFDDGSLGVEVSGQATLVRPSVTVLAAGSTDLPLPFPGGSLPGVFAGRAVLIAVNRWDVLPGCRWALVGGGPERDEVSETIVAAGGAVVATVDPGAGDAVAAFGRNGVRFVEVNGEEVAADCVAVVAGRQPDATLATMAGCELGVEPETGRLVPVVDAFGRTSRPGLLASGDLCGIGSPAEMLAEGRVVGLAAAALLGRATEDELRRAAAEAKSVLARRHESRRAVSAACAQPVR